MIAHNITSFAITRSIYATKYGTCMLLLLQPRVTRPVRVYSCTGTLTFWYTVCMKWYIFRRQARTYGLHDKNAAGLNAYFRRCYQSTKTEENMIFHPTVATLYAVSTTISSMSPDTITQPRAAPEMSVAEPVWDRAQPLEAFEYSIYIYTVHINFKLCGNSGSCHSVFLIL